MFSIFFGRSGAGGGGSSFFFGIIYGPTSFCGPPASGGASCWFGFDGGGGEPLWARVKLAAVIKERRKAKQIRRLRGPWTTRSFPLNMPQNIGDSSKKYCASIDARTLRLGFIAGLDASSLGKKPPIAARSLYKKPGH